MNEQRLVDSDRVNDAIQYLEKVEMMYRRRYGYARGFRDCLEFLGLVEKSPQSGNSKGTRCK